MIWAIYTDAISTLVPSAFSILGYLSPFILGYFAWALWLYYIRNKYILNIDWVCLEIKLPREIYKSPKAMEIVIGNLCSQTYEGPNISRYWEGVVRSWFSLELYSDGGRIHFILRVPKFFKDYAEAQIYAQYPEVELHEVIDYTQAVPIGQSGSDWQIGWGGEIKLSKEDAYPIKTYVDYGMDKDPKEEFKIDPMTAMLEMLGSAGPGEQVWIQILVMAAQKRFYKKGTWFKKQNWVDQGKELVEDLMKRSKYKELGEKATFADIVLSPGERAVVEAVERSISKIGLDCGIRVMYLAKEKVMRTFKPMILSSFKQYNSLHLNGFTLDFDVDPSQPLGWLEIISKRRRKYIFDAYRRRSYFYPWYQFYQSYKRKPFILNTEELATIYHFPGTVAATPTLEKMGSKKTDAPVNLPV